jgi:CheY-like chemotaxis protein
LPVRILVVEDDPLVRELVVEALRDEGYQVIHAATGEEALAWCKRRVADVLITDIKLPGRVDEWQIAERCREHDPELPVIYATPSRRSLRVLCQAVCRYGSPSGRMTSSKR